MLLGSLRLCGRLPSAHQPALAWAPRGAPRIPAEEGPRSGVVARLLKPEPTHRPVRGAFLAGTRLLSGGGCPGGPDSLGQVMKWSRSQEEVETPAQPPGRANLFGQVFCVKSGFTGYPPAPDPESL